MFLAADIGNTNIVLGFREEGGWPHILRIETSESTKKYSLRISDFILEHNIDLSKISGVALSSVVPNLTQEVVHILEDLTSKKVYYIDPKYYSVFPITIMNPEEMGTDLIANSLAAYMDCKNTCIVVDFGTALTFTSIGEDGKILGVSIAPGLKTAMKSLSSNTAKLPEIPLEIPKTALGKNTTEAMQSGILLGYTGLVEKLIEATKKELQGNITIYATGGLSSILSNIHHLFDQVEPNLTLNGLFEFHNIVKES